MPSDLFIELFPVLTTQTDEIIIEYLFISMGSVPSVFKKAIVKPVLKKPQHFLTRSERL